MNKMYRLGMACGNTQAEVSLTSRPPLAYLCSFVGDGVLADACIVIGAQSCMRCGIRCVPMPLGAMPAQP